jgi:hypothetical protein
MIFQAFSERRHKFWGKNYFLRLDFPKIGALIIERKKKRLGGFLIFYPARNF